LRVVLLGLYRRVTQNNPGGFSTPADWADCWSSRTEGAPVTDTRPDLILVIEDDDANRDVFRELLEDGGYRVTVWDYPATTTAALAAVAPDLVLLDFLMGGKEVGWDFLRAMKADPDTVGVPVLVVSAADATLRRVADQLEAWDCAVLRKPFDLGVLLAKVQDCLDRAGETAVAG
jgi:CheY-like chemotaxis protein